MSDNRRMIAAVPSSECPLPARRRVAGIPGARECLIKLLMFALPCLLLLGCLHQRQYRTDFESRPYDKSPQRTTGAVVETASHYLVGYVEFDDQGWQYGNRGNQSQLRFVLDRLEQESKTNGLMIVTYVHGWKHNASCTDSNVAMFHQMLNRMGQIEEFLGRRQHRPTRKIAGIYIGWHGLSTKVEPFKELSFWRRKSAAEEVGHGGVIEVLAELEALRNQNNRAYATQIRARERMSTKLIILGHSFGGDIVYSAVAPILKERMVENISEDGTIEPPRALGDLVVLINPAFEAARFETIERLATQKQFPSVTNCVLAVFTSTADSATGFFFPLGRHVSTVFDSYVSSNQRKANLTAVGHFQPYLNYDLKVRDKAAVAKPGETNTTATAVASATNVVNVAEQVQRTARHLRASAQASRDELTYTFTHVQLVPRANCVRQDPVFNVAVDPAIIPDHDTFTRPIFTRFLSEFLTVFSGSTE